MYAFVRAFPGVGVATATRVAVYQDDAFAIADAHHEQIFRGGRLPKQGGNSSRAVSTLKKPKTANVDKKRRSEMREMSSSASTQDDDEDDFA